MTFVSSASRMGDWNYGTVITGFGGLNTMAAQINPVSAETFQYGLPVKQIGGTVKPIVELATSATDPIMGIIQYNNYIPESQLTVGSQINIIQMGLQATVVLKAGAAITAGKAIEYDPVAKAFITATAVANAIGVCENGALALGDRIKVRLMTPNLINPQYL